MWYVGLNVHSKSSTICVLNEDSTVFHPILYTV